jgi:hypothetical protein
MKGLTRYEIVLLVLLWLGVVVGALGFAVPATGLWLVITGRVFLAAAVSMFLVRLWDHRRNQ